MRERQAHQSAIEPATQNARPFLHGAELEAVRTVLDSGQYGHGEVTERFEQALAAFLGVPDVVAVASGTAALHIGLVAAGIGPGDEVIVPSMTFCATVQAIEATGARPRFAEVDPDTLCITSQNVLEAITPATRAVMPVLYGGRPVDLTAIHGELAIRNITIVEDAAHAFGSFCGSRRVGATGLVTCFSFGPIKNLTCGQGGAIVPRSLEEATHARRMRLLGMVEPPAERARSTSYRVEGFGLRAQMSQINAAIGLVQLEYFPTMEAQRKDLWRDYTRALKNVDGVALVDVDVEQSVPSLCAVRVPGRDRVFEIMRSRDIGVGAHYPPNHLQPAFSRWHRPLPVTEQIGSEIMTLPFHPAMGPHEVSAVVSALEGALR
ncbi:DegT/DnrJ/EryC1/StrS family aminotransferase [Streptomyces sp. NPDC015127]|uniref:DegT/DnrJ/EryC1/StrS family aminotransferase n=1 Tax=Streptomyces sp. NPDC015127 TaxID=3364939 RepID=UPI0036FC3B9A